MALDGVTLAHLVRELSPHLIGARIDKIQQPEKEEVHLTLRSGGQSLRLLLNVGATSARIQLTQEGKKNPPSPPMFCMILRKHLEGGRIVSLEQLGLERILTLSIENFNEYGDLANYLLYLEIMGKHSNLILVDPDTGQILDGIKRYSHALSRHREVLPGRTYILPPAQGKEENITDEETWRQILYSTETLDRPVHKYLLEHFGGVSPELAKEMVIQAGLAPEARLSECGDIDLSRLYQSYGRLALPKLSTDTSPCVYYDPTRSRALPLAFTFQPFQQYTGLRKEDVPDLNDALSLFYESKAKSNMLEALRGSLTKLIAERAEHMRKKLSLYEETFLTAEKSLTYQHWGELLTANLYRIPTGSTSVQVEDYHAEDLPLLTIPLDAQLSGIDNAQYYYRLYNKAKGAKQKTLPLQTAALEELAYLESLLHSLEQARSFAELKDIHTEMMEQGYVAGKGSDKKGKKPAKKQSDSKNKKPAENPQPRLFRSSQGRIIMVGKNNKQNDWLTMKHSSPADLWLHVKNIPGSHVLIPLAPGEEFPDDQTLEEGAALAIHFSQAKGSTLVPVDYTHVKNIKKPNASKPGMVIYEKNWTLYLTPSPDIIQALMAGEETEENISRP